MTPFRLLLGFLALTASLLALGHGRSGWLDWLQQPLAPAAIRVVEPAPDCAAIVCRRIHAKSRVIVRLLEGEMTLFEAAGWFRRIATEPSLYPDRSWEQFPGEDRDEKICRQVIRWASGHLTGRTAQSEILALEWRFVEELEGHLAEHGRVVLPGED